ncbi:MAG: pitrilysin family protein [Sediminibacterium sp.]|nr:pitrilysin family protein [Sediminibacterium sp.]
MLNRTIAPEFKTISHIDVQQAESRHLQNGIPLHTINAGSQEITKLEFIFKAGMFFQDRALIASTTNALLEMGTKSYSANQISDGIDFYGSFLELGVGQDYANITVYSLNKYLDQTLSFVEEVIKFPVFPQSEFDLLINTKKQKHLINSQKVSVLARRRFAELIFGTSHPYGIDVKTADFERVSVDEIKEFHNKHYHSGNCTIIASGKLPENLSAILNERFGTESWGQGIHSIIKTQPELSTQKGKTCIVKEDAIQSAIRIGKPLFNKTHADYFKFQVLNTILGGYFGSRLMANIREDKGYTYGIGSGLVSLVNGGYFYISTEVGVDVTAATLEEIYKELKTLKTERIDTLELETVRNYILGQFLQSVAGPFSLADKFKAIWEFGLDYNYFDNYLNAVKSVTAKELQDLANKYFNEDDMVECVAGKIK